MININERTDIDRSDFEDFVKSVPSLKIIRSGLVDGIELKAEAYISLRDPVTFTIIVYLFTNTNVKICNMFIGVEKLCSELRIKALNLGDRNLDITVGRLSSPYSNYYLSINKSIADKVELKNLPKFINNLIKEFNKVTTAAKRRKRV